MVIASPGVPADREVNLKPNQDTERGLSPTVTQGVRREVPRRLIGEQYSLSFSQRESGIVSLGRTSELRTGLLFPNIWTGIRRSLVLCDSESRLRTQGVDFREETGLNVKHWRCQLKLCSSRNK